MNVETTRILGFQENTYYNHADDRREYLVRLVTGSVYARIPH